MLNALEPSDQPVSPGGGSEGSKTASDGEVNGVQVLPPPPSPKDVDALELRIKDIPSEVGVEGELAVVISTPGIRRIKNPPTGWQLSIDGEVDQRLWSLSKPVTAVALEERGSVGSELREQETEAIVTSSNCSQRYLTIRLQQETGGPNEAIESFNEVLRKAEADLTRSPTIAEPEASCNQVLEQEGISGLRQEAPQFGTARWRVRDGAAFMQALGQGKYRGGDQVLELMREPKQASDDPGNECGVENGFDWGWGASKALPDWNPASKSGWGLDSETGQFVVSQIAWLEQEQGDYGYAVSVLFRPKQAPPDQCVTPKQGQVMTEAFSVVGSEVLGNP